MFLQDTTRGIPPLAQIENYLLQINCSLIYPRVPKLWSLHKERDSLFQCDVEQTFSHK